MELPANVEVLRAQLQQQHVAHAYTDLILLRAGLRISKLEYGMLGTEARAKSVTHTQNSITEARAGIDRIKSTDDRDSLSAKLDRTEVDFLEFLAKFPSSHD